MQRVEVERIVDAPPEKAWDIYTDHAGWTSWAGLGRVTLGRTGAPSPNGAGCVRVFHSARMREEVLSFEPSARMTYRVLGGLMPMRDHFGEVLFEPHARGTRIVWRCQFNARLPFIGGPLRKVVERAFKQTLSRFARHVAS